MRLLLLCFWMAVWSAKVDAARVLAVLPTNTRSHYAMYGRLLEALARRQHHITVISHFPMVSTERDSVFVKIFSICIFYRVSKLIIIKK